MSQQDFNDKSGNGGKPSSGPVLSNHDRTKSIGTAEVSGNKAFVRFKLGVKTENIEFCGNTGCALNTYDRCYANGTECFEYIPPDSSTNDQTMTIEQLSVLLERHKAPKAISSIIINVASFVLGASVAIVIGWACNP
jgi:hypothetical protein